MVSRPGPDLRIRISFAVRRRACALRALGARCRREPWPLTADASKLGQAVQLDLLERDDCLTSDEREELRRLRRENFIALPADHRLAVQDTVALSELAGEIIVGTPGLCPVGR